MTKGSWGGARNSKDRLSDALTRAQCLAILASVDAMIARGISPNRFLTVHWEKLGVAPADALNRLSAFLNLARDWARKRGHEIAWVWIRENDFGDGMKGEHVHILLHIPEPIIGEFTRRMTRRWLLRLVGGKYVKGASRFDTIGQRASDYRNAPEIYRENLAKLIVGYLLKGASIEVAHELVLPRWNEGGKVVGKRWGRSQNLKKTLDRKFDCARCDTSLSI
tara:strand:+ start:2488 stop:3153 length:666 start_codon:yes stop_codon:yes gene_type:complete